MEHGKVRVNRVLIILVKRLVTDSTNNLKVSLMIFGKPQTVFFQMFLCNILKQKLLLIIIARNTPWIIQIIKDKMRTLIT